MKLSTIVKNIFFPTCLILFTVSSIQSQVLDIIGTAKAGSYQMGTVKMVPAGIGFKSIRFENEIEILAEFDASEGVEPTAFKVGQIKIGGNPITPNGSFTLSRDTNLNGVLDASPADMLFLAGPDIEPDMVILSTGNVGIGDREPNHMLSLGSSLATTKIALYESENNSSHYGLGVTAGTFNFNLGNPQARYAFFDAPGGNEVFTIMGDGTIKVSGGTVHSSDRNRKKNIISLEYGSILAKLNNMPIYEWEYNSNNRRHIGPMAQDFHQAFGLGEDNTGIDSIDADGVALAAIKALIEEVALLKLEIAKLKDK